MKKNIIIVCIVFVVSIVISFFIGRGMYINQVSVLEKIKLRDISKNVINYSDVFNEKIDDKQKMISMAILYNFANGKNEVSSSDVVSYIQEYFGLNISLVDVENIGVFPYLVDKNIVYDYGTKKYVNKVKSSQRDIANTPVDYYVINDVKKNTKGEYEIKFDKYVINNPYDILNYYNGMKNREKDIDIKGYLNGDESINVIYDFLSDDIAKKLGKKKGEKVIKLHLKNEKIIIDSIK